MIKGTKAEGMNGLKKIKTHHLPIKLSTRCCRVHHRSGTPNAC
jgi:hypothetical protein